MKHTLRLKTEEKINAWLNLSELTFILMKKMFSKKEFNERMKKIRDQHLQADYLFLTNLGNLKNDKK